MAKVLDGRIGWGRRGVWDAEVPVCVDGCMQQSLPTYAPCALCIQGSIHLCALIEEGTNNWMPPGTFGCL